LLGEVESEGGVADGLGREFEELCLTNRRYPTARIVEGVFR
jgi:hypothetical protein